MTSFNVEQRQILMLNHPSMRFAYLYDSNGNRFGYLTRKEFLNLSPNNKREIKVSPCFSELVKQNQAKQSKFKTIHLQHVEDIKLASNNDY